MRLAKALIWLRVCAGWSEPLLVAHTTLCETSCRDSYHFRNLHTFSFRECHWPNRRISIKYWTNDIRHIASNCRYWLGIKCIITGYCCHVTESRICSTWNVINSVLVYSTIYVGAAVSLNAYIDSWGVCKKGTCKLVMCPWWFFLFFYHWKKA